MPSEKFSHFRKIILPEIEKILIQKSKNQTLKIDK